MANLANLDELLVLNLSSTAVTGAGFKRGFKKLLRLDLSSTKIKDEDLARLAGLGQLQQLILDYTQIDGNGFTALSGLGKLNLLGLRYVPVTDAGLKGIATLKTLQGLYLYKASRITDEGLPALQSLQRLAAPPPRFPTKG